MKTILKSTLYFIAFCPFISFGQLHLRPEAGINLAHVRMQSAIFGEVKNISRSKIGALICYYNTSKTFLETGIFYSGKGYRQEHVAYNFPDYSTGAYKPRDTAVFLFKLNYLEVPLNFGYEMSLGKYGKLSPILGVYVAYALGGEKMFKSSKDEERLDVQIGKETLDNIRAADIGTHASLLYTSPLGLYFRAQYSFGIAVIGTNHYGVNQRNRVMSFSIGYDWKVSKK